MNRIFAILAAAATMLATTSVVGAADRGTVSINDVTISTDAVQILDYVYGPIQPGAYWYDPISGLWGPIGGPAQGQIGAWLPLGGPLRSNASGGNTGVYMNGRQLPEVEVQRLRQVFGVVPPGRYWMTADGVGGPEGGPATFSLNPGGSGGRTSSSGGGGVIDRGPFGTYGSDGKCVYISVEGGDVMGPG